MLRSLLLVGMAGVMSVSRASANHKAGVAGASTVVSQDSTAVRETWIEIKRPWGQPSYTLVVKQLGKRSIAVLREGSSVLDSVQSIARSNSIAARVDSADVSTLVSPKADDGSCQPATESSERICETDFDRTDVRVAIRTSEGLRERTYNYPWGRRSPAAVRVRSLADFVLGMVAEVKRTR